MKILLCGYTGHMGQEVRHSVERAAGCEILCGVDPLCPEGEPGCVRSFADCPAGADVIIDFSHHSLTASLLDFAESRGLPVVLATTGQTEEEKARIRAAAEKLPVFLAANYSLGIATLTDVVRRALALFPDAEVEIVESVDYGETDFRKVMEGDIYDRRKEEEDLESMGFAKQEFVGNELKDVSAEQNDDFADDFDLGFESED